MAIAVLTVRPELARSGFSNIERAAKGSGRRISSALGGAAGALRRVGQAGILGGAAVAGGLAVALQNTIAFGDQMHKASLRTGIGTEALSGYAHAAQLGGTDLGVFEKGIRTMSSAIFDAEKGLATQNDALEALGVSLDDVRGKTPEEQMLIFSDALSQVEDATTRSALAQDIFGGAGVKLLPVLEQGSAALEKQRDEGIKLRGVNEEQAKAAADLADTFTRAKNEVLGFINRAIFAALPKINEMVMSFRDNLQPAIDAVSEWFEENKPQIEEAIRAIEKVVQEFAGHFVKGFKEGILPAAQAFWGFIANNKPALIAAIVAIGAAIALALGPVGVAAVAIAGGIALFGKYKDNLDQLRVDILVIGKGIAEGLVNGVFLAGRGLLEAARFLYQKAVPAFLDIGIGAAGALGNALVDGVFKAGEGILRGAQVLYTKLYPAFINLGLGIAEGLANAFIGLLRRIKTPAGSFTIGVGPFKKTFEIPSIQPFGGVGNINLSGLQDAVSAAGTIGSGVFDAAIGQLQRAGGSIGDLDLSGIRSAITAESNRGEGFFNAAIAQVAGARTGVLGTVGGLFDPRIEAARRTLRTNNLNTTIQNNTFNIGEFAGTPDFVQQTADRIGAAALAIGADEVLAG